LKIMQIKNPTMKTGLLNHFQSEGHRNSPFLELLPHKKKEKLKKKNSALGSNNIFHASGGSPLFFFHTFGFFRIFFSN
jgi:hypothetical protein